MLHDGHDCGIALIFEWHFIALDCSVLMLTWHYIDIISVTLHFALNWRWSNPGMILQYINDGMSCINGDITHHCSPIALMALQFSSTVITLVQCMAFTFDIKVDICMTLTLALDCIPVYWSFHDITFQLFSFPRNTDLNLMVLTVGTKRVL